MDDPLRMGLKLRGADPISSSGVLLLAGSLRRALKSLRNALKCRLWCRSGPNISAWIQPVGLLQALDSFFSRRFKGVFKADAVNINWNVGYCKPCEILKAQPSALNGTIKFDQLSKGLGRECHCEHHNISQDR